MRTDSKQSTDGLSLAQVAAIMGSTPLNVLMHIKRGVLKGVEVDGEWRIDPASLDELLEKRREGEIPAVCKSSCSKAHGCKSCG